MPLYWRRLRDTTMQFLPATETDAENLKIRASSCSQREGVLKQLLSVTVVGAGAGLCAGYMAVCAQPCKPEEGRGG